MINKLEFGEIGGELIMTRDSENIACSREDSWKILIVDDDNFVHRIIREINKDIEFEGRNVEFYSAHSSEEAINILKEDREIALVLLDVFLENEDSGLGLVRYIRDDIKNLNIRIVLITANTHEDLEEAIILNYDINGYESKSDLFSKKMNTVILSALRGYRDINLLQNNRQGMKEIIESISELYEARTIEEFLTDSLYHINSIINPSNCEEESSINTFVAIKNRQNNLFEITGGRGIYGNYPKELIELMLSKSEFLKVVKLMENGEYRFHNNSYISRYKSSSGDDAIIYIEIDQDIDRADRELLDLFHQSISGIFENLCLNLEIEKSQREILYTLGEVTEARAEETGFHVKRVSKYCEILGREYGLSPKKLKLLTNASPMHDIGKVAIPDNILLKPGRLTKEEFEIMKTHTSIGYNILRNSDREILRTAAIIAHEHHEKYNGTGYPRGLKGEEIHILGRIAAIADVFDALGSPRVYKKAWLIDDILRYFQDERGKHFDPKLVDILFNNLDEFLEVKSRYAEDLGGEASNCEL